MSTETKASTGGAVGARSRRPYASVETLKPVTLMAEPAAEPAAVAAPAKTTDEELMARAFAYEPNAVVYVINMQRRDKWTNTLNKLNASADQIRAMPSTPELRQELSYFEKEIETTAQKLKELDVYSSKPPSDSSRGWLNQRCFFVDSGTDEEVRKWNTMSVAKRGEDGKLLMDSDGRQVVENVTAWYDFLARGHGYDTRWPVSVPLFITAAGVREVDATIDIGHDVRLGELLQIGQPDLLTRLVASGVDLFAADKSIDKRRRDFHIVPIYAEIKHASIHTDVPIEAQLVSKADYVELCEIGDAKRCHTVAAMRAWTPPSAALTSHSHAGYTGSKHAAGVVLRPGVDIKEMPENSTVLYEVKADRFANPWLCRATNLDTHKLLASLSDPKYAVEKDAELFKLVGPMEDQPAEVDLLTTLVLGWWKYLLPSTNNYLDTEQGINRNGNSTALTTWRHPDTGEVKYRELLVHRASFAKILGELDRLVDRESMLANVEEFGLAFRVPASSTASIQSRIRTQQTERDAFVFNPFVSGSVRIKVHYMLYKPAGTAAASAAVAARASQAGIIGHWPAHGNRVALKMLLTQHSQAAAAKAVAAETKADGKKTELDLWQGLAELVDEVALWPRPTMADEVLLSVNEDLVGLHKALNEVASDRTKIPVALKRLQAGERRVDLVRKLRTDIRKVYKAGMTSVDLSRALRKYYSA